MPAVVSYLLQISSRNFQDAYDRLAEILKKEKNDGNDKEGAKG
jgi:hypothetical protein